jgi:MFS superfamily sulfate permease-like transporter
MEQVKKNRWLSLVPGALVVVVFGVIYNIFTRAFVPGVAIATEHLVSLPVFSSLEEFWQSTALPDFSLITNTDVIHTAVSLAVIASLESLLSLEATDKLDPLKRIAPTDQELLAQGMGNILSGLIGGLPISAIIVRSSVNINAGAHTKIASIVHGVLILASAFFLSEFLNLIPLSCLAAILIVTGYKLTSPSLYIDVYSRGYSQFIPFVVTVFSILALDTLRGIIIGLLVGIVFVVKNNFQTAFTLIRHENTYLLRLRKDVSFLNKAPLRKLLGSIDNDTDLLIDGSRADYIDMEILEALEDFQKAATDRNIRVEFKNIRGLQEPGSVSAAPLFQDAG